MGEGARRAGEGTRTVHSTTGLARHLDIGKSSDNLSDVKETVSVAQFTKQFGPLTNHLVPGQSVQVTTHGKVHGRYVREGSPQRQPKIDLGRRLAQQDYDAEAGQRLITAILGES